jgi:hypothetical protein
MCSLIRTRLIPSNLQSPRQVRPNDRNIVRETGNRLEELLQAKTCQQTQSHQTTPIFHPA